MIQKKQRIAGGCGEFFIKRIFPMLAVLVALILTACGGGSGGGSEGTVQRDILPVPDVPATTLQYTGVMDMAAITETNAEEMAVGALHGGPGEQSPVVLGASAEAGVETTALPTTLPFDYRQILVAAKRVLDGDFTPSTSRTVQTDTMVENGTCGGSMTLTLHVSDQFPDFTGSMQFDNFCVDEVTQNGLVGIRGVAIPETGDIDYMTMYFGAWTVSTAGGSVTLGGSVTADFISSMTLTMTMNYLVQDNGTGTVYKVENYVVNEEEVPWTYEQTTISSGLYYHPDYGYVEVNTPTAFLVFEGDVGPNSGELSIVGNGLTKALLTCLASRVYQVEADTTGDENYDWSSCNLHWSNLNTQPVALALPEQVFVTVGTPVILSGSGSYDPDGDVLTYSWAFTSWPVDSTPVLSDAQVPDPTFVPDLAGEYMIELTVNDCLEVSIPDQVIVTAEPSL